MDCRSLPIFSLAGDNKMGGEVFRKPIEVDDEKTAYRLLREPLIAFDKDFFLVIGEGADFEYRIVEFDEVDKPL